MTLEKKNCTTCIAVNLFGYIRIYMNIVAMTVLHISINAAGITSPKL